MALYKVTRADGADFKTGLLNFRRALEEETTIHHPTSSQIVKHDHASFLSVARHPTETLYAGTWPWALFRVESVGRGLYGFSGVPAESLATLEIKVLEELPPRLALGPNAVEVLQVLELTALLIKSSLLPKLGTFRWQGKHYSESHHDKTQALMYSIAINKKLMGVFAYIMRHTIQKMSDVDTIFPLCVARNAAFAIAVKEYLTLDQYNMMYLPWKHFLDELCILKSYLTEADSAL